MTPEFKARLCGGGREFFPPGRAPVLCMNGAVACSHPLASAEAVLALKKGGSAADAAIVAAAVLCVAEPHMTGIGGDVFALAAKDKTRLALDGSGWLPAAFQPSASGGVAETSPLSVTIPGAVAAWEKMHQRFGKLTWAELLSPAIRAAKDGVPVAPRVARDWKNESGRLQADADARALFLSDGHAPRVGDLHRNPRLATTLEDIAQNGARAFYHGAAAQEIAAKLQALGGAHAESDFADYYENGAQWRRPASMAYRNWTVWQCPPAGQGLTALLMLRAMGDFDLARMTPENRAVVFADICARAYRWRDENIGDNFPAAPDGDFSGALESAWRDFFPRNFAEKMSTEKTPSMGAEHRDTIYMAAADADGLAVSFINSLFHPFGSGIVAPQSGILLHNRGASFSPDGRGANAANAAKAGRRPLHTIIPGLAESADGDLLAFGVMGGHYQAAGHAWLLMHWLDLGGDLQSALDAPRLFAYPPGANALQMEPGFDASTCRALAGRGWELEDLRAPLGGGQAVMRFADGVFAAASDARKDGLALGF